MMHMKILQWWLSAVPHFFSYYTIRSRRWLCVVFLLSQLSCSFASDRPFFPLLQMTSPECLWRGQQWHLLPESCRITPIWLPSIWPNVAWDQRRLYSVLYMAPYTDGWQQWQWSHGWLDIVSVVGTPVIATLSGEIVFAGHRQGWWRVVVIKHQWQGETIYSSYAHLDTILVAQGDIVQAAQQIGTVWDTGNATGTHLHFQLDRDLGHQIPYWFSLCPEAFGKSVFVIVNNRLCADQVRMFTIDPVLFLQNSVLVRSRLTLFDQEFATFDQAFDFLVTRWFSPTMIIDQVTTSIAVSLPSFSLVNRPLWWVARDLTQGGAYRIQTTWPLTFVSSQFFGVKESSGIQAQSDSPWISQVRFFRGDTMVWSQNVTTLPRLPASSSDFWWIRCARDAVYTVCVLRWSLSPQQSLAWYPQEWSYFPLYTKQDWTIDAMIRRQWYRHGVRFGYPDSILWLWWLVFWWSWRLELEEWNSDGAATIRVSYEL